MRAAAGVIGLDVAELDLQILTAFAEHLPHSCCAFSLEIDEDLVGEHYGRMIARSHSTSVALLERCVEPANHLGVLVRLLSHRLDQHALGTLPVPFAVKHALPRTEVELAPRHRHYHLVTDRQ